MTAPGAEDFFTDESLIDDPFPYFDSLDPRRFTYDPTFILRGLTELFLALTPAG